MANRYWVGGTGSWNATTTNWSASSGGAGGASVPTLVDDVFFDALSNATAYVCTLAASPVCRSVSVAGPAVGNVTIASSVNWSIYGSLTIAATGVTWTMTNVLFFVATTAGWTITTNGVSLNSIVVFNGAGGGWTLGSPLTAGNGIQFRNGTLTTNNFNMTTSNNFDATGANARTLNLGSSTITCQVWTALAATNLTIVPDTSTIVLTGAAGSFSGGGLTYYNVTKNNNGFAIRDANNTFNALTNTTITANITYVCSFAGNQTIGTLTINGGSQQTRRATIQGTTPGVQVTLTVATFVTNGYIDFRDINLAGAASPLTVATGGDAGNNTNITLQTPKTVYWSLVAGGAWTATAWALTSGGAPALANYPLAQDTIIIEDTGLNSGATITFGNANVGTVDASTRTLPMTLAATGTFSVFLGDFKLSSAVTTTTGTLPFSGYNKTQTFTSAGVSVLYAITVNGTSTTFALDDALTSTAAFTLTLGTLNLNAQTLTNSTFSSTGSSVRSIAFNNGTMAVSGATFTVSGTNFSTSGSGTISMTSASSKTFAGGGFSYPTLNQGGAGTLVITGANTFANISNTVQPCTITFPASINTTVSNFNVNGTAGNLVTINSSTPGTRFNLVKI